MGTIGGVTKKALPHSGPGAVSTASTRLRSLLLSVGKVLLRTVSTTLIIPGCMAWPRCSGGALPCLGRTRSCADVSFVGRSKGSWEKVCSRSTVLGECWTTQCSDQSGSIETYCRISRGRRVSGAVFGSSVIEQIIGMVPLVTKKVGTV